MRRSNFILFFATALVFFGFAANVAITAEPNRATFDYLREVTGTVIVDIRQEDEDGNILNEGTVQGSFSLLNGGHILTAEHVTGAVDELNASYGGGWKINKITAQFAIFNKDGVQIGKTEVECDIVAVNRPKDIAILKLKKDIGPRRYAKLYRGKEMFFGMPVLHCASPMGQEQVGTLLRGWITAVGRPIYGQKYDQLDIAAYPGCSGGGIFTHDSDPRLIGILTLGTSRGGNMCWFVPVREIIPWMEKAKLGHLLE